VALAEELARHQQAVVEREQIRGRQERDAEGHDIQGAASPSEPSTVRTTR